MRVLFLLNAYEEDGPGLLIWRIASLLSSEENIEISSAALSRGGPLENRFVEQNIPTHIVGMRGALDWPGYRALKHFLRQGGFDVVHTNILRADLIGRTAAHAVRIPVIISTEHGIHAWEHKGPFVRNLVKRFYHYTVHYTSTIVAVSEYVKQSLITEGVPPEKIVRIYNGTDVMEFSPLPPEERDKLRRFITDEPVQSTVGLVGNLVEMKGLRYFIKALPIIFKKYPECLVLVVGEGPLKEEMKQEVQSQDFSSRVKFLGRLEQITERIVSALDVLVQPSLTESFGLTAAEALSCEVPVVATNVGGLPELVNDGVCGYLVEPRDHESLAAKVIDLLDHPDKRQSFGKAGRTRVMQFFQLGNTARQYLQLYKRFLE